MCACVLGCVFGCRCLSIWFDRVCDLFACQCLVVFVSFHGLIGCLLCVG